MGTPESKENQTPSLGEQVLANNQENQASKETIPLTTEAKEVQKEVEKGLTQAKTDVELEKLKKDIEGGKMSFELTKKYLESLKEMPKQNKPFLLSGILSGLNKLGISIESVKSNKIILKPGKDNLTGTLKIATRDDTISYQNLLNNHLEAGNFDLVDFTKANLYRTSSLDTYLKEKVEGQSTSTKEYVIRLMEHYNLSKESAESLREGNIEKMFAGLGANNEKNYLQFKQYLANSITENIADRDFLITYFDSLYYNKAENIKDNYIEEYKNTTNENTKQMARELSKLDNNTLYSLGIKDKNDFDDKLKKWGNNPLEAISDSFKNGGIHLGIFLGIIGAIFWGKEGFFGGLLGGAVFGALGTKGLGDLIKKGGNGVQGLFENHEAKNNPLYKKYKYISRKSPEGIDKKAYSESFDSLFLNEQFLNSHAINLDIFNGKPDDVLKYFSSIGIDINDKNKDIYKSILEKLKKDRISAIGNSKENESIKEYLERTKKEGNETTDVAVTAGTSVGLKETSSNRLINKNDIINNLGIDSIKAKKILLILNTGTYSKISITSLEELYNKNKLETIFKKDIGYYNKNQEDIMKIIKYIIDNSSDKTKNLKDILK